MADTIVRAAAQAALRGPDALSHALDAVDAPMYATDADGVITHFNHACTGFAGRAPEVGKDRWCVTWKLYTDDGEVLPHEECPMALALRGRRPIRGVVAVAERPDGARVTFQPFPTPVFAGGELLGAVNLLMDVTEVRRIEAMRAQSDRCLRLSRTIRDPGVVETLTLLATELGAKADELERSDASAYRIGIA